MARRDGDGATLAHAIRGYIEAHHSPDHTFRQLELARELVTLAGRAGDKERVVDGHEVSVCSLIELGDMRAAKEELAAMTEFADELRQPSHQWFVGVYRALMALLEGHFQEAEDLIPRARAIGERAQTWNAEVAYRLQLYLLHRARGTLEEIHELLSTSAEEYPSYPIWRCVLASAEAASGHLHEARVELEALTENGSVSLPFDEEWLVGVGLLAETAATLSDVERASWLYDLLRPYPGRVAICYPEISTGSVARPLAILATTMRSWEEAEVHFERALETNARIGARPWLAETQDDYARMLLARGDGERAFELLARALTTYRHLGMDTHAARASRLIASTG
jgi:tetratricopeptide (TPR) repeat protein